MFDDQSSKRTLRTATKHLPKMINFTTHLYRLYLLGNVALKDDDIVIINGIEFIRNISSLISQQSPRTVQNYMIWRFVIHRIPNMPKRFRTILDKLRRGTFGSNTEQSRTMKCIDYVNDNMGLAVSKLYINKYFDKLARDEVYMTILYIIAIRLIY